MVDVDALDQHRPRVFVLVVLSIFCYIGEVNSDIGQRRHSSSHRLVNAAVSNTSAPIVLTL